MDSKLLNEIYTKIVLAKDTLGFLGQRYENDLDVEFCFVQLSKIKRELDEYFLNQIKGNNNKELGIK